MACPDDSNGLAVHTEAMTTGNDRPGYGNTSGPQDGDIQPIPVPQQPVPSQSPPASAETLTRREIRRKQANGLLAISGGLATVIFLFIGFVFHGWAWGWIVFLIPGLLRGYLAASE